jgi:hypothetical protein
MPFNRHCKTANGVESVFFIEEEIRLEMGKTAFPTLVGFLVWSISSYLERTEDLQYHYIPHQTIPIPIPYLAVHLISLSSHHSPFAS